MSICDFLFSADLCVPSVEQSLSAFIDKLGLPQPGPGAFVKFPNENWDVVFALVNKAFATAPTRLEIIGPLLDEPRGGRRIFDDQAPRRWRTHATVVATPDIGALAERVRSRGLRAWLQPQDEEVPFDKLWVGAVPGDIADYQPSADFGFRFEFIPSNSSAFAPKLFETPTDTPRPGETGFRRIRHRAFLVSDIDATLRGLEENFGWEPTGPVRDEPSRGYRFADMSANHAHGAGLRLVQPTNPDTAVAADLASQGPGPYTITISVFDLDATAADLTARGTKFTRLEAGRAEPAAIIPDLPELGVPVALVPDS